MNRCPQAVLTAPAANPPQSDCKRENESFWSRVPPTTRFTLLELEGLGTGADLEGSALPRPRLGELTAVVLGAHDDDAADSCHVRLIATASRVNADVAAFK